MSVKKNSVILLHGVFDPSAFDQLEKRKGSKVFIMEGRPGLEGARTSSRECLKRGIKPTLIADNMAGFLFYRGLVKEVWLSSHASDTKGALCRTGGLVLSVLGHRHKVPVKTCPGRKTSRLMGRRSDLTRFNGTGTAPFNTPAYVPLVEWVPAKYIGKSHG